MPLDSPSAAEFRHLRMATSRGPGSALSIPKRAEPIEYKLPEIGQHLQRCNPHASLKDALMKEFGKSWKTAWVEGKVLSLVKTNLWRIEWTIGEKTYAVDHGKVFFKVPKQKPSAGPSNSASGSGPSHEGEDGAHGEEHSDSDEHDGSADDEQEEDELEGGTSLECKLDNTTISWKILPGGVPVDPRAVEGHVDKRPKVLWDAGMEEKETYSVDDCLKLAFPMDFLLSEEGSLGYTNAILPDKVKPFTAYEYTQCLGVLLAKCLVEGSIRDLWKTRDSGIIRAINLSERFGISRDRFLTWMRYVRFCPKGVEDSDIDLIKPLIDAWNARRQQVFQPGNGLIVDESISKFRPFFEDAPGGIQWLVKIIRKPVGIGAEIKNTACAETGILLFLELQEGQEAMKTKEFRDK